MVLMTLPVAVLAVVATLSTRAIAALTRATSVVAVIALSCGIHTNTDGASTLTANILGKVGETAGCEPSVLLTLDLPQLGKDKQTNNQTNKQTNKQPNKQTHTHTNK
jgi:hypothetical protein